MRTRFATALTMLAVLPAAPAWAQSGGTAYTPPPVAPLTVGGLLGSTVRWTGTVARGGTVHVQRLDPASAAWSEVATATAADDGTFSAAWAADALGTFTVRAVLEGTDPGTAPTTPVTVYRPARATWYGPGFYGRRMACGGRLTRTTVGGAHRKLPCGTPVEVWYAGHSLVVPVVDRGPFANGASLDLTGATAAALGMTATSRVGAVVRPAAATAKRRRPH